MGTGVPVGKQSVKRISLQQQRYCNFEHQLIQFNDISMKCYKKGDNDDLWLVLKYMYHWTENRI